MKPYYSENAYWVILLYIFVEYLNSGNPFNLATIAWNSRRLTSFFMCTQWNSFEKKPKHKSSINKTIQEHFWSKNWCKKSKSLCTEQVSHDYKFYRETQMNNALIIHLKPNIENT